MSDQPNHQPRDYGAAAQGEGHRGGYRGRGRGGYRGRGGTGGGGDRPSYNHSYAAGADAAEIPQEVTKFLQDLTRAMLDRDLASASELYETKLPQINHEYFSSKPMSKGQQAAAAANNEKKAQWPKSSDVKIILSNAAIEALYVVHQFRSIYSTNMSPAARTKSWDAFEHAFRHLLNPALNIAVPIGWLFDVTDEYVYQLQMFGNRRLKGPQSAGKEEERSPEHVGSVTFAVAKLEELVAKTGVKTLLDEVRTGGTAAAGVLTLPRPRPQDPAGANFVSLSQRALGLFALLSLIRVRTCLADYYGTIELAEPLSVFGPGTQIVNRVPAAHISLFYYVGFAHLMLRRYEDASRLFMQALTVKAGNRKFHDVMQWYCVSLLLLSDTLGGLAKQVDYLSLVAEKNKSTLEEDVTLVSQGDIDRIREVFARACPKFIAAATSPTGVKPFTAPNGSVFEQSAVEARENQISAFMREVSQYVEPLKLRSLLQVYSSVCIAKLGTLLSNGADGAAATDNAVAMLLAAKNKGLQLTNHDGKQVLRTASEIDFTSKSGSVAVHRRTVVTSTLVRFADKIIALGGIATK